MPYFMAVTFVALHLLASAIYGRDLTSQEKAGKLADTMRREPLAKIATVHGKDVLGSDLEPPAKWYQSRDEHIRKSGVTMGLVSPDEYRKSKFFALVNGPLIADYRKQHHLEPTEAEIQEFARRFRKTAERRLRREGEELQQTRKEVEEIETRRRSPNTTQTQRGSLEKKAEKLKTHITALEYAQQHGAMDEERSRQFAQFYLPGWKLQHALYKQYGGRVIFQQAGPEALDGMQRFFEEQQAARKFAIHDPAYKEIFWAYYKLHHTEIPGTALESPWASFEDSGENNK